MELDIATVCGGPLDVNTYVVGKKDGDCCVLIDPGAEEEAVREALHGRQACAVLLTHAHFDHMLYAAPWLAQGAKLYIHKLDAPALADPELNLSTLIGQRLSLPAADVLLDEGDEVCEAGLTFTVLHTPGHTPGGACYLCGQTLFCGDTLFYHSYGRIDLPGGDAGQMVKSLARLSTLDGETIAYPGHGMRTKIAWERGMHA